jgi:putative tributyrin esterase
MALVHCDFFSDVLGLSTSMTVILPQETASQIGMSGRARRGEHPVLYLLHGLSDDHTTWTRRTSIERYVAPLGLAVVMPQVGRSYYTDQVHAGRYWTFLSEELPEIVGAFFPVSADRDTSFVAGLSMGGYGALKWALRFPDRFAAAASLSGAVDVVRLRAARAHEDDATFDAVFGNRPVEGTSDDLHHLVTQSDVRAPDVPRLYVCCGTEDPLLDDNRAFVDAVRQAGGPVTAEFSPGGHDWGYWDAKIQDVLAWLPLE